MANQNSGEVTEMSFLLRKMIRKLPGMVIQTVPKPEPIVTEGFGSRENYNNKIIK